MSNPLSAGSRLPPGGGNSNDYSDNPEDWGIPFATTKSAESFYAAQAAAAKARAAQNYNLRSATNMITSAPQERPNPTGVEPGVAPSGMGGGSSWQEPNATGLVPPGSTADIPVYDQQKVEDLAQRTAAPGIRKLRDQVQQVQGGVYDNPNVKAMTLRQALSGYGSGLESVTAGALGTASGMYQNEYQPQVNAAMQANQLAAQAQENRYNRSFQAWLKTGTGANTNARGLPIPAAA